MTTNKRGIQVVLGLVIALWFAVFQAQAAIPGQEDLGPNPTFHLTATDGYISMPDGASIYSWGYANSGNMQVPGPTLIVKQGAHVTITLTNSLPPAAGNTSIIFPGQQVTAAGGQSGLLTQEAQPGGSVAYTFTASQPGTYLYHSGTRTDLQVEMGLYGAIVVRPDPGVAGCAHSAYNMADTCFDREYLFILSELQFEIHQAVEFQASGAGPIQVSMEPYTPEYWMINGRSAPSTMEELYSPAFPHQPYNSMPRMHPGEKVLLRVVGAGRQMHSFHTHGNHVRVLARDGQLLLSPTNPLKMQSKLEFSIPSLPGQTVDGTFEWTGRELGWDIYGHTAAENIACSDTNGDGYDDSTWEWCADHNVPIPVTLPNPNVLMNGGWYSGGPFMGGMVQLPPGQGGLNPNAGYVYMWHSHIERELTYGNIFPGGMMTMLIVEPPTAPINEWE